MHVLTSPLSSMKAASMRVKLISPYAWHSGAYNQACTQDWQRDLHASTASRHSEPSVEHQLIKPGIPYHAGVSKMDVACCQLQKDLLLGSYRGSHG